MNTKKLCNQLHITQKLLRTYEEKGLIKPVRRDNNYRDYTIDDVAKIKCIMLLRELSFSYDQIRIVLLSVDDGTTSSFEQIFYIHLNTIKKKIDELQHIRSNLNKCINDFLHSELKLDNALATILNFESNLQTDDSELSKYKWNFDSWADNYDENVILKAPEHQRALDYLKTRLRKDYCSGVNKVLDVGCGSCYLWRDFENSNLDITALDNSLKMLFYAKEKLPWLKFVLADILEDDLPVNSKYNLITSTFFLHHIPYKYHLLVLSTMLSLLETRGQLILIDRMYYDQDDTQALRNYYLEMGEFLKVNNMATECLPYVSHMTAFFEASGCEVSEKNLDKGVWMLTATRRKI